ncbi:MAG TPA: sulfotransferase, partial [Fimbriimonas sp.]|nr:sulfotransferase [Fimbriimonas sp.]
MALKVVGAGLGRTGTHSLKLGLEKLLGAPCYHMAEVFERPQDVPVWHQAALGNMPDWDKFLAGYAAEVDWPSSAFWDELSQAYPESLILLSVRDPESWWESASQTIFGGISGAAERNPEWFEM